MCVSEASYSSFLCATGSIVVQKGLKHTSVTLLHWVTCFFTTLNMGEEVCILVNPTHTITVLTRATHTCSCYITQLEIVPKKYTIYSRCFRKLRSFLDNFSTLSIIVSIVAAKTA